MHGIKGHTLSFMFKNYVQAKQLWTQRDTEVVARKVLFEY